MGFPKHQNFLLLTNTSQITNIPGLGAKNLPKINDTPRAAADARATLLLLLDCCCRRRCCCGVVVVVRVVVIVVVVVVAVVLVVVVGVVVVTATNQMAAQLAAFEQCFSSNFFSRGFNRALSQP